VEVLAAVEELKSDRQEGDVNMMRGFEYMCLQEQAFQIRYRPYWVRCDRGHVEWKIRFTRRGKSNSSFKSSWLITYSQRHVVSV
jgi:hypothetical protein